MENSQGWVSSFKSPDHSRSRIETASYSSIIFLLSLSQHGLYLMSPLCNVCRQFSDRLRDCPMKPKEFHVFVLPCIWLRCRDCSSTPEITQQILRQIIIQYNTGLLLVHIAAFRSLSANMPLSSEPSSRPNASRRPSSTSFASLSRMPSSMGRIYM